MVTPVPPVPRDAAFGHLLLRQVSEAPEIDRGLVWPPLLGRTLVQQALTGAAVLDHHCVDDEVVLTLSGWRLHSPAWFNDVEAARAVLLAWAQAHVRLLALLSSRRCLFVIADGGGYRLWQLVGTEMSVWQRLTALVHADDAEVAAGLAQLRAVCSAVETTWSAAPHRLPCTLETIAADDGTFVGLLPTLHRLSDDVVVPVRSSRLHQQLHDFLTHNR